MTADRSADGPVHRGADVDRGAEPLLLLGELVRVAGRGALVQQVQHQALGAQAVGAVGGDAGVELDGHAGHRHGVALGVDDLDAVRQRGALDRREVEVRRPGRSPGIGSRATRWISAAGTGSAPAGAAAASA